MLIFMLCIAFGLARHCVKFLEILNCRFHDVGKNDLASESQAGLRLACGPLSLEFHSHLLILEHLTLDFPQMSRKTLHMFDFPHPA